MTSKGKTRKNRSKDSKPSRLRRVLIVTPGFSADEDDWCIPVLKDLVLGLADTAEMRVLSLRYPAPAQQYSVGGVPVVAMGGGTRRRVARLWLLRRSIHRLVEIGRRFQPDVLHAFWSHEPGAVTVAAGAKLGRPAIVTVMGGELAAIPSIGYGGLLTPSNRWLSRRALARARRVVTISDAVHDAASRWCPDDRRSRIDHGVNLDLFSPGNDPAAARGFRFLIAGSLTPVKDHRTALQALALCRSHHRDLCLSIVGDGELRLELENLIERLGLNDAVDFLGTVDRHRMPDIYQKHDALVVSSLWEGASMVTVEALACGLPVVGTRVGLLAELDGCVATAPPGNHRALAEAMSQIASDAALRHRLSSQALETAKKRFDIDRSVASHLELYDKCITEAEA